MSHWANRFPWLRSCLLGADDGDVHCSSDGSWKPSTPLRQQSCGYQLTEPPKIGPLPIWSRVQKPPSTAKISSPHRDSASLLTSTHSSISAPEEIIRITEAKFPYVLDPKHALYTVEISSLGGIKQEKLSYDQMLPKSGGCAALNRWFYRNKYHVALPESSLDPELQIRTSLRKPDGENCTSLKFPARTASSNCQRVPMPDGIDHTPPLSREQRESNEDGDFRWSRWFLSDQSVLSRTKSALLSLLPK